MKIIHIFCNYLRIFLPLLFYNASVKNVLLKFMLKIVYAFSLSVCPPVCLCTEKYVYTLNYPSNALEIICIIPI